MTIEGQPRLSQVVAHLNTHPELKSAFCRVRTAPELIDLLPVVPDGGSAAAAEFIRSTMLFHDLESGRKVISSLCSGICSATDTTIDVQLLRSSDGDYHVGHRLEDEGRKLVFYVSVPAGRWCPPPDGND